MMTSVSTNATKIATPTRKHFALGGPSRAFDARIDAARGDLADIRLADRVFAPHYAAAVLRTVLQRTPITTRVAGEPLSEALAGEPFEVLELARGHSWGVSSVDGTVGFVATNALGPYVAATHVVNRSSRALPLGTRTSIRRADTTPLGVSTSDFVAIAESLAADRVPTVSGGRSGAGVDAAGLVFLCLSLAGVPAPRFTDLQATKLGHLVAESSPILRGDLIFSGDSVAIATGAGTVIYAGAVCVELVDIAALGAIALRRRLP